MTNKFTEEQYQDIINLQEDEYRFSILEGNDDCDYSFWRRLINAEPDIASFANENKLIDELAALANPLTREWAHDQFVEKEKKYYWKRNGLYLKKDEFDGSIIFDSYKNLFTESEIIFWGYNPAMFNKEEV